MNIYSVSIMAFKLTEDENGNDKTLVFHLPALIPAASIEDAADAAKCFALNQWRTADDWYGLQAMIMPVTEAFYKAADDARAAGVLDFSKIEQEQCFTFDSELEADILT